MGQKSRKRFFLFGSPIALSPSPMLHNTGFKTLGLPHFYDRHQTTVIDDTIKQLIHEPDFGGASVTIPLKLDIIPLLDSVTEDAKYVGAVNTIIPSVSPATGKRVLIGDNTDWRAIVDLTSRSIAFTPNDPNTKAGQTLTALVIGAGGTSRAAIFALHHIGFKAIYLFNRTATNALKVIDAFPKEYNIAPLTSLDDFPLGAPAVIVSTVPGDGTTRSKIALTSGVEDAIYLPESLIQRTPPGVVVDMSYKPRITPLVELGNNAGWTCITGIELLLQQGYHQFRIWTGKKAPEHEVAEAVLAQYNAR